MTEIFIQIYNSADRAICSIPDGWPYKILMGILLIAMSKHIMLFTAFAVLVALDCIRILSPHLRWGTRWSRSFA